MFLSGYRCMWVVAMFDLPVDSKEARREYTRFVKHLSLNTRRKRSGGEIDDEALLAIPDPAVPQTSRAELAAALAGLHAEQREVVLMRFVDDMTLAEIAQALEVPTGTVKSRLHRALETLRNDPRTREYFA